MGKIVWYPVFGFWCVCGSWETLDDFYGLSALLQFEFKFEPGPVPSVRMQQIAGIMIVSHTDPGMLFQLLPPCVDQKHDAQASWLHMWC